MIQKPSCMHTNEGMFEQPQVTVELSHGRADVAYLRQRHRLGQHKRNLEVMRGSRGGHEGSCRGGAHVMRYWRGRAAVVIDR